MKTCTKCKKQQELSSFHKNKRTIDGHTGVCKSCCFEYAKVYYARTREKQIAVVKEWNEKNKERKKENWQKWYAKNREKLIADRMKFYWENIERERATKLQWREKNRARSSEKTLAYYKEKPWMATKQVNKRRAAKILATPKWADQQAIEEFYRLSYLKTHNTGIKHNVDHTVPLLSKKVCGLHCEANLRITTQKENYQKSNSYWPDMW